MFAPWSKDQFLDLWRSFFPDGFVVPIEEENGGFGLLPFAAQAAIFARLSEALNVTTQAYYLRDHSSKTGDFARGEARATGELVIRRTGYAGGDVTVTKGTEFVSDVVTSIGVLDGERFRATSDVTMTAGSLGPVTVPVEAVRPGWQGNVPAGSITRFAVRGRASIPLPSVTSATDIVDSGVPDRFTLSMIGQYARIVGGANGGPVARRIVDVIPGADVSTAKFDAAFVFPDSPSRIDVLEFADLGLTVDQPSAMTGGRHGWLDAIGADRGVGRAPGESDDAYRLRIGSLDDTISPAAIMRILTRILDPLGIPWRLKETRDPSGLIGTVWDWHAFDYGTISDGVVFAPPTRFFVVCVGASSLGDFGFPFDAPFVPPPPMSSGNAWDVGFVDGYPVEYYAAIAALWSAIDRARAAGIGWLLVRDTSL
jgi:hypothetical protein